MVEILVYGVASAEKGASGRAFSRTTYMKHRAGMMQTWADYLDQLAKDGDVIQFKAA